MTEQEASLHRLLSATTNVVDDIVRDLTGSRGEVMQLREAMETRAPIEQARGMLMMRYGLSAEEAVRLLLRWSRNQQVELRVLAITLVTLGINEGRGNSHQQFPAWPDPSRAVDALTVGSSHTADA